MGSLHDKLIQELEADFRHQARQAIDNNLPAGRLVRIVPERTLPVSVTGQTCQQNCAHCNGHYLKGMVPISRLFQFNFEEYDSVLISGGGLANGEVALSSHAESLLQLPERLSLNLHPGFQSPKNLLFLKDRKVIVSFDLPASDNVVKKVFNLPYRASDYQRLFLEFSQVFPTVPHINLGLDEEEFVGERETIDFLAKHSPQQLVFIIFRPTPDTLMSEREPPNPAKAIELISYARKRLNCPIKIGCMRPSGEYRRTIDILAWLHGIEHFVQADRTLVKILQQADVEIEIRHQCCAL
jgi:uncharacterized radical SAM superfamily protein